MKINPWEEPTESQVEATNKKICAALKQANLWRREAAAHQVEEGRRAGEEWVEKEPYAEELLAMLDLAADAGSLFADPNVWPAEALAKKLKAVPILFCWQDRRRENPNFIRGFVQGAIARIRVAIESEEAGQ